jgi:hypothetical protein
MPYSANQSVLGHLAEGMQAGARTDAFNWGAITIPFTSPWRMTLQATGVPLGLNIAWAWAIYRRKGQ